MSKHTDKEIKNVTVIRAVETEPESESNWDNIGEFPASVRKIMERGAQAGVNRKNFLALMGASVSMASLNCFKSPIEKIVPYVNRPKDYVPGVSKYYATSRVEGNNLSPILVKTSAGKPLKIEGHHEHPYFKGAVDGDTIATIWDLYDPDRIKTPLEKKANSFSEVKWEDAIKKSMGLLKENVLYVGLSSHSVTENKIRNAFLKSAGNGRALIYDAEGAVSEALQAETLSFGSPFIPFYRFDKADIILSLEADFLGTWLQPELFTKQFSSRRDPKSDNMNRLIVAEANLSVTGSSADERYAIHGGSHIALGLALANLLLPGSKLAADANVRKAVENFTPSNVAKETGLSEKKIIDLANELKKAKGRSLVVSGGTNATSIFEGAAGVIANLLNTLLNNDGKTIETKAPWKTQKDATASEDIAELVKKMKSGSINTLVIDRSNPVYDLAAYGFGEALKKVPNVIYIGYHKNETANMAKLVLPVSHFLEGWNDAQSLGFYYVSQPVIRTLFNTRSAGDILLSLSQSKETEYTMVQKSAAAYGATGKTAWNRLLSDGFIQNKTTGASPARRFRSASLQKLPAKPTTKKGYTLNLYSSVALRDGKGSNISFRQELPDPISKMTWGNYLAVSVSDARKNNWKMGYHVKLTANKKSETLPVFVQPGLKAGTVSMAIGYGQKLGQVANEVGSNAYNLITEKEGFIPKSGIPVTIESVSGKTALATTQKHYELARERGLVRSATLKEYRKNDRAGHEHEELPHHGKAKGLYKNFEYSPVQWNMNIDLSKCTGCSACVVSCYSENNIPAVGKDQVLVGREMSWMRIDRYYSYADEKSAEADADMVSPGVYFQPVLCQHCEIAPCENVCPVGATGHSEDGINYMTYNRCIGTRYCSNNCPFKVRRFNYFEFWEGKIRDPEQYALNPDVTVRSRGVIEKCSFCQQRISEKRQNAKVQGVELKDGDVKTACQQACSADAITFGNVKDKTSVVSKLKSDSRSYQLLAETNVRPAVSYMVKIRNQG